MLCCCVVVSCGSGKFWDYIGYYDWRNGVKCDCINCGLIRCWDWFWVRVYKCVSCYCLKSERLGKGWYF